MIYINAIKFERNNIKIYLSLLSNKNLKVYGSNLLIKGKSCNFVNSQKQVNKFAKYDLI